jgi:hypothetical protein
VDTDAAMLTNKNATGKSVAFHRLKSSHRQK